MYNGTYTNLKDKFISLNLLNESWEEKVKLNGWLERGLQTNLHDPKKQRYNYIRKLYPRAVQKYHLIFKNIN